MNKKLFKNILFVCLFCFCFPSNILAVCSNQEKIRLSSLAKNISVTYDHIEQNNDVSFNITVTNLTSDLIIKDVSNNKFYGYTGTDITLYGYSKNKTYRFDIYGTGECYTKLYSHYVTLPGYNPYYNDPACVDVNAGICSKWVNMPYDYSVFLTEVAKYKKSSTTIEETKEEEILGLYDYIIRFIISYYYIIFPVIIVGGIIGIIYLVRKDDLF